METSLVVIAWEEIFRMQIRAGMRRSGDGRDREEALRDEQSGQGDGDGQRQDHGKADGVTAVPVSPARLNRFVNGVLHQRSYR